MSTNPLTPAGSVSTPDAADVAARLALIARLVLEADRLLRTLPGDRVPSEIRDQLGIAAFSLARFNLETKLDQDEDFAERFIKLLRDLKA